MLDNIIYLYEYIKELLQYVNGSVDQPENKISAILDAEEQLSQIAIEHGYAKRKIIDDNNNMLSSGNNVINVFDVKVKFNEPRSEIYSLRDVKKIKEKNCICCNSQ